MKTSILRRKTCLPCLPDRQAVRQVCLIVVLALFYISSYAQTETINPFAIPGVVATVNPLSYLSVNIHFVQDDQALDYIQMAGFNGVRMDCPWVWCETVPGVYNFTDMDLLLSALDTRGLKALFILDYGTNLYPNANPPSTDTARMHFANYAQAAAQHFLGRGVTYEIWNEPNISCFWNPVNAASYTALVKIVAPVIHQADSCAEVISGGLSGVDTTYLKTFLANGGGAVVNSIGVHPYRSGPPELSLANDIQSMRNIVSGYFPANTTPLRSTEWGYSSAWYGLGNSSVGRSVQAKFMVRSVLSTWALNIPSHVCYDIRDDGTDSTNSEHNFGLLDNAYAEKPAGTYMRTLINAVKGKTYQGVLNTTTQGLYALKFDSLVNTTLALWLTDPLEAVYPYPLLNSKPVSFMEQPLSIVNSMGVSQAIPAPVNGLYTINVGFDPIYVTFANIFTGIISTGHEFPITIFPNPTKGMLNIQLPQAAYQQFNLTFYNVMGEQVKQINSINYNEQDQSFTLSLEGLPAGMYFYNVISNNSKITKGKIIKE